jgi:hypothetical protein
MISPEYPEQIATRHPASAERRFVRLWHEDRDTRPEVFVE